MSTVIEHSRISPPAGTPPEFSLPMVFFDLLWYGLVANQGVLFFEFPDCCLSHFMDTIVADLKASLSLTLSHFLPFSGNIIHPLNPQDKPILRYQSGDSVSFTVAESSADFNHLIGNHPRSCHEFSSLAPQLPRAFHSEKSISCPVLAVQVTLFPGQGLCIGFVTNHAVGDANTVARFIHAWALINRSRSSWPDNHNNNNIHDLLIENKCLPFFDRKTVTNLNGLDSLYWSQLVKLSRSVEPPPVKPPSKNLLCTTFVLKKDEIQKLKALLLAKCPTIPHLSSLTVVCALVWVCSSVSAGEEVAGNEPEYFGISADCRGRLKPSLPDNYFGNCISPIITELKHGEVIKGPADGFVAAAKAIGDTIKEDVRNEEKGALYGAENWLKEFCNWTGKRLYGVAGSPRFDFYAADYGWGKPNKFEVCSSDGRAAITSLSKSRDFEGGLEIGFTKPALQMDAFATTFRQLLLHLFEIKTPSLCTLQFSDSL